MYEEKHTKNFNLKKHLKGKPMKNRDPSSKTDRHTIDVIHRQKQLYYNDNMKQKQMSM